MNRTAAFFPAIAGDYSTIVTVHATGGEARLFPSGCVLRGSRSCLDDRFAAAKKFRRNAFDVLLNFGGPSISLFKRRGRGRLPTSTAGAASF